MDVARDLALLYAAWPAVPVELRRKNGGNSAGRGILDAPGTMLLASGMISTDYSLRYPVSSFLDVRKGDAFVINQTVFIVREAPQAEQDGLECSVFLSK